MPAIKMKTKLSTGCLREKNGFHVCKKSSIISKSSCSHVRISRQEAEFETCIQSCQNVSSSNEVSTQKIGSDEAIDNQELIGGENLQLQKQPSSLVDSETMGRMEFPPATFLSNLETIFSPILESIEVHRQPNICCEAVGSNNDPAVPLLTADDSDDVSGSSCDYQTCNVSDFYISDMIVSGLPVNENTEYDDISEINPFLDYKCSEPSLLFDVAEYMVTPFFEETVETSDTYNAKSCEEAVMNSDDSCLYLAIHQMRSCNQESDVNPRSVDSDEAECFDPHLFIRNFPDASDVVPKFRSTIVQQEKQETKPITLILDLDETLVHSALEHCDDADFTFPVFFNMKEHTVYVKQRPYLHTFLERVAEMFEILVFTASQSIYASRLLDILDPDGKLISRRAYRESCIFSDGSYTKDLTVLGVDLAKVAIIDNSPQVFQLQVNNGIPIKSWFDDPSDCELISLLPFLETLVDADDVRPIIAKRFGNKEL